MTSTNYFKETITLHCDVRPDVERRRLHAHDTHAPLTHICANGHNWLLATNNHRNCLKTIIIISYLLFDFRHFTFKNSVGFYCFSNNQFFFSISNSQQVNILQFTCNVFNNLQCNVCVKYQARYLSSSSLSVPSYENRDQGLPV